MGNFPQSRWCRSLPLAADMDGSTSLPVIADGQWHLYEWDLDSTTDWGAVSGIGGGHGGVLLDGQHTIDSIYLRDVDGTPGPTAEIFLDFVAWNPTVRSPICWETLA